eukprot:SAG31_NODE_31969_length_361_cov_1.778626_1_plen_105_part_10
MRTASKRQTTLDGSRALPPTVIARQCRDSGKLRRYVSNSSKLYALFTEVIFQRPPAQHLQVGNMVPPRMAAAVGHEIAAAACDGCALNWVDRAVPALDQHSYASR